MAKFYITGLYRTPEFNDDTLPPLVVEGNGRLEALANTGCTVWTEEEWHEWQRLRPDLCKPEIWKRESDLSGAEYE